MPKEFLKKVIEIVGVVHQNQNIEKGKISSKTPPEIARAVCDTGYKKSQLRLNKVFVIAILTGVYIGFCAQFMTTVRQNVAPLLGSGFALFLGGAAFSVGLMLIVIGGAELFTGNCLMSIAGCDRKATLSGILKNWIVVYLGNFAGALLLVVLVFSWFYAYRNPGSLGSLALTIADAKVNLGFIKTLCRGILCNWLVCLAIWMAINSRSTIGKIFGIFSPITAFVALGFEHNVANMYFIPLGIFLKASNVSVGSTLNLSGLTWEAFFAKNLIPVSIGNIIGGAIFVGLPYWAVYLKGTPSK